MIQQGDVLLRHTPDGGEIDIINGVAVMSGGLEVMAYHCLFGGNEDDDGRQNNNLTWWGNINEPDQNRHYRSETQYLLKGLPATSGNLRRVENAALRDLQIFIDMKIATGLEVIASIPKLHAINIAGKIFAEGGEQNFKFIENWRAAKA